ncbi:hypothetical protein N656DRAFT_778900 [Canariomyces notabilis]|uniref:DUF8021 domain-containing protein n=1 Tax=Canariomyces notabilis TaxID=2074819 RepID=A0AAN6TE30_9PEZI|nr:hypothetical protein N656DRAFT_778900 [Canariomyces arenarius]
MSSPLATLTLLALLAISASSACTRPFLINTTTSYLAAQEAGNPSLFQPFTLGSPNFIYLENNQLTTLTASRLSTSLKVDFSRSIHDTTQCAAFTEIIAANDPNPHVIHTRMVFDPATEKATLIESVVTTTGDWLFNATGTLALNAGEDWTQLPVGQQASREEIQTVGDAYFDRFKNVSVTVPWGAPCYRLEGGLPARGEMQGEECVMVWPSTIVVPYRRYVVDETVGAVDLFVGFPGLDRTQGQAAMPDSHLFRVEGGKIKYLHTASACVVDGCGLNGTTFGNGTVLSKRWLRSLRKGGRPVPLRA